MKKGRITIKAAAEILGVSVETLRNWDKKKRLTAERDRNGYRVYTISDLERFAKQANLRRPGQKLKLVS